MKERLEELVDHPWEIKDQEEKNLERIQGVMYVQHTKHSKLAKLIRERNAS